MFRFMRIVDAVFFVSSLAALTALFFPELCPMNFYLSGGLSGLMCRVLCYLFGVMGSRPDLENFHYGYEYCSMGLLLRWANVPSWLTIGVAAAGLILQVVELWARRWETIPPIYIRRKTGGAPLGSM